MLVGVGWWCVCLLFVLARALLSYTNINKGAQHFPTLKIDFYFLYTECGGLVCLFVLFMLVRAPTNTNHLLTDSVSGPYFCM